MCPTWALKFCGVPNILHFHHVLTAVPVTIFPSLRSSLDANCKASPSRHTAEATKTQSFFNSLEAWRNAKPSCGDEWDCRSPRSPCVICLYFTEAFRLPKKQHRFVGKATTKNQTSIIYYTSLKGSLKFIVPGFLLSRLPRWDLSIKFNPIEWDGLDSYAWITPGWISTNTFLNHLSKT